MQSNVQSESHLVKLECNTLPKTHNQEDQLSEVFNVMNRMTVTYETREEVPEDAPRPTPDPDENIPEPETITVLIVNVRQYAISIMAA